MIRSCAIFCARLDDPRREQPPLLHLVKQRIDILAARQRPGEDVGGRDRVLDREVDADAADRRHGVRGIADREQPGPVPAGQPVELHGQQVQVADLVELGEVESRRGLRHFLADRLDPRA